MRIVHSEHDLNEQPGHHDSSRRQRYAKFAAGMSLCRGEFGDQRTHAGHSGQGGQQKHEVAPLIVLDGPALYSLVVGAPHEKKS